MKRLLTPVILLAATGATPAFSQGFEATFVAGYTTPGGLPHNAVGISDLKLKGSFTWGASGAYFFSPRFGLEGSWARQESAIVIGTAQGSAEVLEVDVNQFHGGVVYQFGDGKAHLRPFLSADAGVALFSAMDLKDEAKLSLGLAAGLKWMLTAKAGVTVRARYTPIHLNDSSSDYCDPFGFCQGWLHQLEVTGGVVVRF